MAALTTARPAVAATHPLPPPPPRPKKAPACVSTARLAAARAGDSAAVGDVLAAGHGLMLAVARRHAPRLDLDDVLSAGALAVLDALPTWDPALGSWTNHLWWKLRSRIVREHAAQRSVVRVPQSAWRNGARPPTVDPLHEVSQGERAEGLVDPVVPPDPVVAAEERAGLAAALAALPPRDADVVRRRWGLGGAEPATLEAIGADVGISRERVRQIERQSLDRLRIFAVAGGWS